MAARSLLLEDTEAGAPPHSGAVCPFGCSVDLPARLEFTGEFGAEVNSFVPLVYWLHRAGLMRGRHIRTYRGMKPFYFFLDADQIVEKNVPRQYVFPNDRPPWLPNRDDHAGHRSPFEMFPDYRGHFRNGMFDVGRPLLVIHNKATPEWGRPPVNILSLPLLDQLFGGLAEDFHVVYLRPGLMGQPMDYSGDRHQPDLGFDDLALLHSHRRVEIFDQMAAALARAMPANEVKLRLYAHADFHITVQGGNAHLLSLFSGGMAAIFHRAGQETRHSYARGHFGYASSPPPRWLICRTEQEVARCVPVFRDATVVDGQVLVSPAHAETILALSPSAQREPANG